LIFQSYNFQSKKPVDLVHIGVDFCVQNALRLLTRIFNSRNFSGGYIYPGPPIKGEGLHHGRWGMDVPAVIEWFVRLSVGHDSEPYTETSELIEVPFGILA